MKRREGRKKKRRKREGRKEAETETVRVSRFGKTIMVNIIEEGGDLYLLAFLPEDYYMRWKELGREQISGSKLEQQ